MAEPLRNPHHARNVRFDRSFLNLITQSKLSLLVYFLSICILFNPRLYEHMKCSIKHTFINFIILLLSLIHLIQFNISRFVFNFYYCLTCVLPARIIIKRDQISVFSYLCACILYACSILSCFGRFSTYTLLDAHVNYFPFMDPSIRIR